MGSGLPLTGCGGKRARTDVECLEAVEYKNFMLIINLNPKCCEQAEPTSNIE